MDDVRNDIAAVSQRSPQRRAPGSVTNRSAVTNGKKLLEGIDGRSPAGRRYRDLIRAFEAEIGGPITEVERGLIRQAAALMLRSEQMQSDVVNGHAVNADELIRLAGTARRMLETLQSKAEKRKSSAAVPMRDRLRASA